MIVIKPQKGATFMDKKALYLKVYQMFDRVHPLRFNCGRLCDQVCCRGTDTETGMYLFPGEEELHQESDFLTITEANFQLNGQPVLLATCTGSCNRSMRPLACRIFPLTPIITPKDILLIKMDPRAGGLCPLARKDNPYPLRPEFKTAVRRSFAILIQDPEIRAFLREFSTELQWF